MKKIRLIILLAIILFINIGDKVYATETDNSKDSNVSWPKGPEVFAESAILMESSTGTILYSKNIQKKYYPASITKIMTTLVAAENSNLSDIVTYSKEAIFGIERDSSHIWLDVGEQITMEQSLYAIMLESANEAAYGVAEHVAGSMDAFVEMMNEKATSLGCKNTHFVNSNGLHDDEHYTSAYDMALISREALKNKTFRTIASTKSYQIPPTNKQPETRYLVNHHKMALTSKYAGAKPYEGCFGGKTGYTTISKNTLVTFAKRGNLELICVVLKSDSTNIYEDTKLLLDYGFNNYSVYNIASEQTQSFDDYMLFITQHNKLFDSSNPFITLDQEGNIVLPKNANIKDTIKKVTINKNSNPDLDKVIGSMHFLYGDKDVGSTNILCGNIIFSIANYNNTKKDNETNSESDTIATDNNTSNKISKTTIIAASIVIVALVLLIYYVFIELPRLKRRRSFYNRRRNDKGFF